MPLRPFHLLHLHGSPTRFQKATATLLATAAALPVIASGKALLPVLYSHAQQDIYAFDLAVAAHHPSALPPKVKPGEVVAHVTVNGAGNQPVQLHFKAAAPGADYATQGKEDAPVAVQLDGRTVAIVPVYREAQGPDGFGSYDVDLGRLSSGCHQVQIRQDSGLVSENAPLAQVQGLSTSVSEGMQGQIDSYAPILYSKHPYGGDPRETLVHTDAPVQLRAKVQGDPDGYHLITYYVTLTDEDAGTPDLKRNQIYGRFTDDEWVYKVLLDGQGNKVSAKDLTALKAGKTTNPSWTSFNARMGADWVKSNLEWAESYQYGNDFPEPFTVRHTPKPYRGIYEGTRPVIADHSGNNNFIQLTTPAEENTARTELEPYFAPNEGRGTNAAHELTQESDVSAVNIVKEKPLLAELSAQERAREGNH